MKIAVIGAMDEEVALMSGRLEEKEVVEESGYKFEVGKINGHDIILTVSSIGQVATGMLMGTLFHMFTGIDKVVNIGVAGGVFEKVNPGDVVLSEKLSYSAADARGFGYEYGQIPRCPKEYFGDDELIRKVSLDVKKGMILTSDVFQVEKESVDKIINEHYKNENVMCFDMESTAFAQCSYRYNVGFLAIRAISDIIGADDQTKKYENALEMACKKADDVLMEILNKL